MAVSKLRTIYHSSLKEQNGELSYFWSAPLLEVWWAINGVSRATEIQTPVALMITIASVDMHYHKTPKPQKIICGIMRDMLEVMPIKFLLAFPLCVLIKYSSILKCCLIQGKLYRYEWVYPYLLHWYSTGIPFFQNSFFLDNRH